MMATVNNKEYYLSDYVIFQKINDKNEYVLIHSYLNNIDIVEEEIAAKILKIKNDEPVDEIDEKIFNELVEKGYLVNDKSEDKNRFEMVAKKLSENKNKYRSYILILTYNCNFSCPYCFEGKLTRNNNILMDEKMVDIIFDIIDKDKDSGYNISLSLFGGEPLLKENLDINRYIFKKAKQRGLKISVITNGYDLDHYISYIKNNIFSDFQITLDGNKEKHNKNKFTKDDKNTFDKILDNIDMILKTKTKSKITVRINTNKDNISSLNELKQIFDSREFSKDKRFSFYTKSVDECVFRKDKELSDLDIVNQVSFFEDKLKNMRTNSQYSFIIQEIDAIFDSKRKFGNYKIRFCGATGNNKLIDPYGDIYSCLEEVGKKDRRVGFIDQEKRELKDAPLMEEWKNRTVKNMEECLKCEYALICGGGCAVAALRYTGSLKNHWCAKNKEIAKEVIKEKVSRLNV